MSRCIDCKKLGWAYEDKQNVVFCKSDAEGLDNYTPELNPVDVVKDCPEFEPIN